MAHQNCFFFIPIYILFLHYFVQILQFLKNFLAFPLTNFQLIDAFNYLVILQQAI